jgi:hypothetical protein
MNEFNRGYFYCKLINLSEYFFTFQGKAFQLKNAGTKNEFELTSKTYSNSIKLSFQSVKGSEPIIIYSYDDVIGEIKHKRIVNRNDVDTFVQNLGEVLKPIVNGFLKKNVSDY